MNSFVLGAGLGTRLRSLTEHCPKPLIPVFGKPLITFAFDQLIAVGADPIVVNTHHRHEAYAREFSKGFYNSARLLFEHEPVLLETAGGIKNAERHFGPGPLIVYNGDVLASLPLQKLLAHHQASGNEVTLALRSQGEPAHISLDATGRVVDIAHRLGAAATGNYLFSGIYIVEPEFIRRIPERTKISVIPIFMEMIKAGEKLGGIPLDEGEWWDLGNRDNYLDVHAARDAAGRWVHETAQISPDAQVSGFLAAGPGAAIEAGAQVTDCILWEGARVLAGSELNRCIVTSGRTAAGRQTGADF